MSCNNIRALLSESVLHHDYRSRCVADLSGEGNDGVMADMLWTGQGIQASSSTSKIVVADSPELQLTECTLVVFGDFTSQTAGEYLISKWDAGGINYAMYLNATHLRLYDGLNNREALVNVIGKKYISISVKSGEKAEAWIDGVSIGDLSDISTITANAADVTLLNFYAGGARMKSSNIKAVLIFPRKLTATEHSQLYGYLSQAVFPTSTLTCISDFHPNQNDQLLAKTDYGVNESQAAITSGQLENSPFEVVSGGFKIATDTYKKKYIECMASGVVAMDTAHFRQDRTEAAYGTWEWTLNKGAALAPKIMLIASVADVYSASGQNGFMVEVNSNNRFSLSRISSGAIVSLMSTVDSYVDATRDNVLKITRDASGVFTLYINNVKVVPTIGTNPVTSTSHTTSKYFNLDLDTGDKVKYSNINGSGAIVKRTGI